MDEASTEIREQMEETKSQLSQKLESLEQQVSETVQSTGNAVNATVETVQQTFDSVTTTVKDAVQSVVNAFDVRRQVERHPWVMMSGAVVLGYLAREILMGPEQPEKQISKTTSSPPPAMENRSHHNGASHRDQESATWTRLQNVAMGSLVGIASDITARAVPAIMDYLAGHGVVIKPDLPAPTTAQEYPPKQVDF